MNKLIKKISQISDSIRYFSIYHDNNPESWQRAYLNEPSSSDSYKYEGLLAEPKLKIKMMIESHNNNLIHD